MVKFRKMHGLGNDFVILDLRDGTLLPARDNLATMTDRRTGIGCDQVIPVLPARNPQADAFMMIVNPDGSEAESCGNATRCVADILMKERGTNRAVIETAAGLLECSALPDGRVSVDMGAPKFGWRDIPLAEEKDTLYLLLFFPSPF